MASERLRRVPTRSGEPTIEVDGVPYHSPYNPLREVEKFYASLRIEGADVVLHFGWGLGYAGKILRERARRGARIVVFEPDAELFEMSAGDPATLEVLHDPRFQFVVGPKVSRFFEDWGLGYYEESDQFLWIEWPAALRQHGSLAESLKLQFKTHLRDRAGNLLTHFLRGETYFQNAIENFEYQGRADVGRLFGVFRNTPLVIVSAGPSLDSNIQDLRGIEDRCFILSVDTALRPLLAAGITPHAVISADPSELNARHIAGVMPESVYLIAEQAVHPSALQSAKRHFLFGLGLFPDSLFAKFGFARSRLDVWGSVATAALDLACRMGSNPVIFAGQDLAYSWGRDYASYTMFHGRPFSAEQAGPVEEPDIRGRPVHTNETLIAYRDFFTRKILRNTSIRFINATEGGILREGPELLSLRHAIHRECTKTLDVPGLLHRAYRLQKASTAALRHLLEVLNTRPADCDCLTGFLDLVAKEAVLKQDSAAFEDKIRWGIEITQRALAAAQLH
jgi:hypothetical protein